MQDDQGKPPAEDERTRRRTNLFLLFAVALVIAAGIWLVDALIAQRKLDDCLAQGRRNCVPLDLRRPE